MLCIYYIYIVCIILSNVQDQSLTKLLNERYQWSTSCNKKNVIFALTYLAFLQFNNDRIYSSPVRLNYIVIALWFCKQNYLKYGTVISLEPVHVSCHMFIPKCHWHRRLALKADIFFLSKVDSYRLIEPSHLLHRSIHGKSARKLINIGFGKLSKEHFLTEAYFSCGEKCDLSSNYIGKAMHFDIMY